MPRLQYLQSRSADEVSGLQNKVVPFEISVEPSHKHNRVRQNRIVKGKDGADLHHLNAGILCRTEHGKYEVTKPVYWLWQNKHLSCTLLGQDVLPILKLRPSYCSFACISHFEVLMIAADTCADEFRNTNGMSSGLQKGVVTTSDWGLLERNREHA